MRLTVIVPTFRRPVDLDRCLRGLSDQDRRPDQVIVTLRPEDGDSPEVAASWLGRLPLEIVSIERPGVVQALNLGVQHATGDIITITDDDSVPHPDWLARIEQHFASDSSLGGLGGRDVLEEDGKILSPTTDQVGLIKPYGRIIGNHHLGFGPARYVDHLKGVNMSWRAAVFEGRSFDENLRGRGAQVYFELAFALDAQRRGWKLVYDPAIAVNHYPAARFDNDRRGNPDLLAHRNAAFNLCIALRRYMQRGFRRTAALLWMRYIGSCGHPGLLRGLWFRLVGNGSGSAISAEVARAWHEAKRECASE